MRLSFAANRVVLLTCLGVLFVTTAACAQSSKGRTQPAQLSKQEILQEMATTQRLLADEEFIAGDRASASQHYKAAALTISRMNSEDGFMTDSDLQLQADENAYRQLLLEREESFWGTEFYARPINPVASVKEFETTYGRLKELVTDVNSLADRLNDKNTGIFEPGDQALQNERDKRVAELQNDIADVRLRDADIRRAIYQDRKAAIHDQQARLGSEIQALEAQIAARDASLNSTLATSLVQAVGIPPVVTGALTDISKGDYGAVLTSAVQQYAGAPALSNGLPASLKSLAVSAQDAARDLQKIKQTVGDAQEQILQGQRLLKTLQSSNRDELMNVGKGLMGQLSPSTQKELLSGMAKITDLQSALRLAGSGTSVRAQVAAYVSSMPVGSLKLEPVLKDYLRPQAEGFTLRYQQVLSAQLLQATDLQSRVFAMSSLARAWPATVVREILLPQGNIVKIADALSSPCKTELDCTEWLTDRLGHSGLQGIDVTSDAGQITIMVSGRMTARFSVVELTRLTSGRVLETNIEAIQTDLDSFITSATTKGAASVSQLIRQLPDTTFDEKVAPLLTALPSEERMALLNDLTGDSKSGDVVSPAARDAASLALGQDLAKKTVFAEANPMPVPEGASTSEQVALNAMKASGPYGYAAAVAIQLLSGIAQNGVAIDQINAKAREDHNLTVEALHISAFETELNKDQAIAALEQRISKAQATTASRRSDRYEQFLVDQGSQITIIQAKIRRRLPLIYVLSEQLRQQFQRVDHAIGFWQNDLQSQGQFVERTIRSDPQFRRLGLDPDISLYNWFNRDVEGQRQDIDALFVHWQGIESLLTMTCAKLHCGEHDAQMGQVEMTDIVHLKDLVGADEWERAARTRTLLFTLLPQSLPNLPDREGLRLVHISGGVSNESGKYTVNPSILLQHSGMGYITAGGKGYREVLDTSREITPKLPMNDKGASAQLQKLQVRWTTILTLEEVEGYPLFGIYKIRFPQSFDFAKTDLDLRFYYQFNGGANSTKLSNRDLRFTCRSAEGHQVSVSSIETMLILRNDRIGRPSLGEADECKLSEVEQ